MTKIENDGMQTPVSVDQVDRELELLELEVERTGIGRFRCSVPLTRRGTMLVVVLAMLAVTAIVLYIT